MLTFVKICLLLLLCGMSQSDLFAQTSDEQPSLHDLINNYKQKLQNQQAALAKIENNKKPLGANHANPPDFTAGKLSSNSGQGRKLLAQNSSPTDKTLPPDFTAGKNPPAGPPLGQGGPPSGQAGPSNPTTGPTGPTNAPIGQGSTPQQVTIGPLKGNNATPTTAAFLPSQSNNTTFAPSFTNAGPTTTTVTQIGDNKTYPPGFSPNKPTSLPKKTRRHTKRHCPLSFEEEQRVMLESIPPNSPRPNAESMMAFNALLQQNMPLTPQQVVLLRQQIDMSQRAAAIPANIPPKPVSTTIMVNLAPGVTPPVIRLAQGYVSSIVFVDSTGTPWPIAAFDIGNPRAVNIQWDGKSNILLMQAVLPYSDGNFVVRLVGLPTPISLEIVSGQRVVDYRVDLHVPGIGPLTKDIPLGTTLPSSANQLLLDVLSGVAPAGSRLLSVSGADSLAWVLGERLYLRTRFTVLSPGWVGKMTSADGMQAYELPKTSSILISRYGEPVELKIEGL